MGCVPCRGKHSNEDTGDIGCPRDGSANNVPYDLEQVKNSIEDIGQHIVEKYMASPLHGQSSIPGPIERVLYMHIVRLVLVIAVTLMMPYTQRVFRCRTPMRCADPP